MTFKRVSAESVELEVGIVVGYEAKGVLFFPWAETKVVGAQCSICNAIAWVYQRRDPILNEAVPKGVPESGDGYRRYFHEKTSRFLGSIPPCPSCGSSDYDRFVTNFSLPRFLDGTEPPAAPSSANVMRADPSAYEVLVLQPDHIVKV
ncbi:MULTISPECIES: hypothetical protein [Stenotrophomonas]|uniref:hypothetical protein n=1 Tax=Stenotrophomonas TaxID=40323 RepID=UPI00114D37FB|nr:MULTISPECIES: hypothetical protein [Stenotrophomonas]